MIPAPVAPGPLAVYAAGQVRFGQWKELPQEAPTATPWTFTRERELRRTH